jgi:hypothetical protein
LGRARQHDSAKARPRGSRSDPTLPGAAHFPHLEDPDALSEVLREFLASTQPGRIDDAGWGGVLSRRSPPKRISDAAA